MKQVVLPLLFLFFTFSLYSQNRVFKTITFEENSEIVNDESEKEFQKWISSNHNLQYQQDINIHCLYEGYETESSYQLQRERGILISQMLEGMNIENQRIIFISEEDDLPDFMMEIQLNEIVVEIQTSKQRIEKNPSITQVNSNLPSIKKQIEDWVIYTDQESTLFLDKGSIIDIPEYAFETLEGEIYEGRVVMEIIEILDYKSAYANQVMTMSNEGILESRGMIDIQAETIDGETLQLRKDKALGINLPVGTYDEADVEGFNIYNAIEVSDGEDTIIEWSSTPQEIEVVDRNIRNYRIYRWTKIPSDIRAQIKQERAVLLEQLKTGRSKQAHRKIKKSYKKRFHKLSSRNKKKKRRIKKTYKPKDYSKIRRRALLGDANFYWEEINEDEYEVKEKRRFFSFRMLALGMLNIDRPVRVKYKKIENDLIVHTSDNSKVTILFKNDFCMLNAKKKRKKSVFKNIPKGQEVVVFSARENGSDKIYFSKINLKSRTGKLTMPKPRLISKKQFSNFLESIKVQS